MISGIAIQLGDRDYVLPPMTLGAVERYQRHLKESEGKSSVTMTIDCLHSALLRNYPDLPREVIADNVDLAMMNHYVALTMDSSGMLRKAYEEKVRAVESR